jgi:YVTN family beta-propeller protein
MMNVLEFRVLGPLEVVANGRPVAVGGPKQRALLSMLLLSANRVVARERLLEELFANQSVSSADHALHNHIFRLRKALVPTPEYEPRLVSRSHGYLLRVEPGELDLERFERLVDKGRQAAAGRDPAEAARLFRDAEALWRGRPLADLEFEPFARLDVERLEELRVAALEDRLEADLELGRHSEVVSELEVLVAQHPLRERLRGQLMLALYRSGRQADALRAYRETRRELVEELGIEPGPALRELESRILRQDVELDSPKGDADGHTVIVTAESPPQRPELESGLETAPTRTSRRRSPVLISGVVLAAAAALGVPLVVSWSSRSARTVLANSVAVIDPTTNKVLATEAVGTRPSALVEGSGSVWVANLEDRTITRLDPRTRRIGRTIPVAVQVAGLASGAGPIWYSTSGGSLDRIDPSYDSTAQVASAGELAAQAQQDIGFPLLQRPLAVASGSVWVANPGGFVSRVNPRSGKVLARIPVGRTPAAIAASAGSVWVASPVDDTVSKIDPTNAVATIPVGHGPSGIAVGGAAVWVTDRYDDTVERIDPSTSSVVTTIPVGLSPDGIAFAAGAVWVADSHDGTIMRIDPATNKVVRTIHLGGDPTAIAAVRGQVWVTVSAGALPIDAKLPADVARFTMQNDLSSPDPALAFDFAAWQIEAATCSLLAGYPDWAGPSRFVPQPQLARSASHSRDGRTWTFQLRRGVRFSPPSGEQVSAATVKHSLERALDPRMPGGGSYELPDIVGEGAFLGGKAPHITGIAANGYHLTIRLTRPLPDLLARLAVPNFCVVPSDTPVDPNGLAQIPSAGPYYMASYIPGQELVLRRNPNYSGPRPSRLAEIVYEIGIGQTEGAKLVEQGRSDYLMAGTPAPDQEPSTSTHGKARLLTYPSISARYLALNTRRPLFARLRVRQAVSYAIDRTALAGLYGSEPIASYLPPGVPGDTNKAAYPLRPDLPTARKLAGNLHATAVFFTSNAPPGPQVAALLTTELGRIGIRLRVKEFPGAAVYGAAVQPNAGYDIVGFGWAPNWLDPSNVLTPFFDAGTIGQPNNVNFANFANRQLSARMTAALSLYPPQRYHAFARLEHQLEHASPLVAYSALPSINLLSSRIGCPIYQPLYGIDLAALCVKH